MQKRTVQFTEAQLFTRSSNGKIYADVTPVDHPDKLRVTNGRSATTSEVISSTFDEYGNVQTFETQNTSYVRKVS